MALCFVGTVHNAVRELHRYNAWAAEWNAMGGYDAPAASTAKPWASRGKMAAQALVFALLAWVFCNLTPAGQTPPPFYIGMFFLMCGACLWKVWQLIAWRNRGTVKKAKARAGTKDKTPAVDIVEWSLPPAASSPTRADVVRRLPDYAVRLIGS